MHLARSALHIARQHNEQSAAINHVRCHPNCSHLAFNYPLSLFVPFSSHWHILGVANLPNLASPTEDSSAWLLCQMTLISASLKDATSGHDGALSCRSVGSKGTGHHPVSVCPGTVSFALLISISSRHQYRTDLAYSTVHCQPGRHTETPLIEMER